MNFVTRRSLVAESVLSLTLLLHNEDPFMRTLLDCSDVEIKHDLHARDLARSRGFIGEGT